MRETFYSHNWKFPSSVPAAPWPLLAGSCDRTPGPVLGLGDRWLLGKTNTRWAQKQGKYVTIIILGTFQGGPLPVLRTQNSTYRGENNMK